MSISKPDPQLRTDYPLIEYTQNRSDPFNPSTTNKLVDAHLLLQFKKPSFSVGLYTEPLTSFLKFSTTYLILHLLQDTLLPKKVVVASEIAASRTLSAIEYFKFNLARPLLYIS